jgi:hypothetical protein
MGSLRLSWTARRRRVATSALAGLLAASAHGAAAAADELRPPDPPAPPAAPADGDARAAAPEAPPAGPEHAVALVLLSTAGAAIGVGIGFGVASVVEHRRSRDILQRSVDDEDELLASRGAYAEAISARDDLRVVSGVAAGAGLALFVAAGALFAIDEANRDAHGGSAPAEPPPVALVPAVGPRGGGASATIRF